jgi:hypothetical protein
MLHAHFSEVEPGEIDESDATREGLRYPFGQVWRGRAKEKKPGRTVGPIHQYPEQFEEIGPSLNLVDNYQTGEFFQCPHGRRQSADVHRILKIVISGRFTLPDHLRKSSLATLAWTQKGCNRVNTESFGNAL